MNAAVVRTGPAGPVGLASRAIGDVATGWLFGDRARDAAPARGDGATHNAAGGRARGDQPATLTRAPDAPARRMPGEADPAQPAAGSAARGVEAAGAVMARIVELNPGATLSDLSMCTPGSLDQYLRRLLAVREPRGRSSVWVRVGDSPAIVARRRRA